MARLGLDPQQRGATTDEIQQVGAQLVGHGDGSTGSPTPYSAMIAVDVGVGRLLEVRRLDPSLVAALIAPSESSMAPSSDSSASRGRRHPPRCWRRMSSMD
jgi:hypothetical protein